MINRSRILWAAAAIGAAALAAGCGSAGRTPAHPTATIPAHPNRLTRTAPAGLAGSSVPGRRHRFTGPSVGTPQPTSSEGARLTITIQRLIDPLTGSGAALLPGTRAVAILVQLENLGTEIYDSSATSDFSLVASAGPVTPVFVPKGICQTPVEDFDRYLTTGAVASGCIAFAVPDRARVLAVRFSPYGRSRGRLTWLPH
jgi:hypothetical protein